MKESEPEDRAPFGFGMWDALEAVDTWIQQGWALGGQWWQPGQESPQGLLVDSRLCLRFKGLGM